MTQTPKAPALTITMHGDWEVTTNANTLVIRFGDIAPATTQPALQLAPEATKPLAPTEPTIEQSPVNHKNAEFGGLKRLIADWMKTTFAIDPQSHEEHKISELVTEFIEHQRAVGEPLTYNPHSISSQMGIWVGQKRSIHTRRRTTQYEQYRVVVGLRRKKPLRSSADKTTNRIDFNT